MNNPFSLAFEKRLQSVVLVARIIALGALVAIFCYPMVVASMSLGLYSLDLGWAEHGLLISAIISLLLANPLRNRLFVSIARKRPVTPSTVITAWLAGTVFQIAILEFSAVSGLALSLLTGKLIFCVVFGLASFVLIARSWPSEGQLRILLQAGAR